MIQLSEAGQRFGPKTLFEDVNWLITPKERAGIVGANGTGKSTLLKVLAGIETLDYGTLSIGKGIRAGYLPQDGIHLTGRTVFAECMSVFAGIHALEAEQQELSHRMAELDHESAEYQQVATGFIRQRLSSAPRTATTLNRAPGRFCQGWGSAARTGSGG